jgi:hypothetical protein
MLSRPVHLGKQLALGTLLHPDWDDTGTITFAGSAMTLRAPLLGLGIVVPSSYGWLLSFFAPTCFDEPLSDGPC